MASTLAQLGFDIDTSDIKDATKSLGNLDKQSGKSEKSASKFSRGYSASMAVAKKATFALTAAAVGAAAAIAKYTSDGLDHVDAQAKLARAMGATIDGLRAVQLAASDAGIDNMGDSLNRLNRRLGAAALGNKEYGKSIDALGLDLDALSNMDVDQRIAAISDVVKESGLSHQETARHLQMLGFQQSNANAFFRQGGDAVRAAAKEVEDYGLSLSAVDAAKVESANDQWSRLSLLTESATSKLAVEFAPVIQSVAQYITGAAKEGEGMGDDIERGAGKSVEAFAYLADVAHSIETVFQVMGKGIAAGIIWLAGDVKQSIGAIVTNTVSGINYIIDAANMLGAGFDRVEIPSFATDMLRDAEVARGAVADAMDDIHETLMKEPPSVGILAAYEESKKAGEEAAKSAVELAKKTAEESKAIAIKKQSEAGKESGKEFEKSFESSTKSIADSLQDAIIAGDWKGLGATIGGALAGGIAAAVSESMGGGLGGGFGGAVAGGLAGLVIAQINDFMTDDYDPTEKRQASQGTGTVLGSINDKTQSIANATGITASATSELIGINRAMLIAMQNVSAGIANASSRVARNSNVGIAAPGLGANNLGDEIIGANLDALSFLSLGTLDFGKMLGGKSKKKDDGIQIVGGYMSDLIDETIVNAYATFRVKKNAWSKTKTKSRTQALSDDVGNQFSLVFESVLDSVIKGSAILGIGAEATKGFKVGTQKLSLEGMNAADRTKAIEEYFGTVFDNLAMHTIPWLEDFQQAGEGLGETLARVGAQIQTTNEVVKQLGVGFQQLEGANLAAASQYLVDAAGGLEQLGSSTASFIKNFESEARQFEINQDSLTTALSRSGLPLADTRDGYLALMKQQDASTKSGADNIAILLRLQSHANEYYNTLEQGAESAKQSAIEMLNSQQSAQSSALAKSLSAANAVNNALSGLSTASAIQSRMSALDSIRSMTSSGSVGSVSDLQGTLSAATNINASDFATFDEYIRTVSRTGAALVGLKQVTDSQVTKDQQLLTNIENEIKAMSGELIKLSEANVKQSAKSARILERIEVGGIEVKA